jgi:hypothetical protein
MRSEKRREYERRRRKRRRRESEAFRAAKRRYDSKPEVRAKLRARSKRWRAANPEADKAHDAVRYAIRVGRLVRGACAVCGDAQTQGHHDDYRKVLEVVWLCARHHRLRHLELV